MAERRQRAPELVRHGRHEVGLQPDDLPLARQRPEDEVPASSQHDGHEAEDEEEQSAVAAMAAAPDLRGEKTWSVHGSPDVSAVLTTEPVGGASPRMGRPSRSLAAHSSTTGVPRPRRERSEVVATSDETVQPGGCRLPDDERDARRQREDSPREWTIEAAALPQPAPPPRRGRRASGLSVGGSVSEPTSGRSNTSRIATS